LSNTAEVSPFSTGQGDAPTALPLQPPGDFEFKQNRADNRGANTGQLNEVVDRNGRRPSSAMTRAAASSLSARSARREGSGA
jgi:hypothetical protein